MALPPQIQAFVDGPKLPKVVLGVVVLAGIVAGSYFLAISPVQQNLATLEGKKSQVEADLAKNRAAAAQIDQYRKEIADLEKKLVVLREKLPSEKETPALYKTVSDAAQQSGLGVALFQPGAMRPRDFVNEIPITLNAEGGYHELGRFFARVASLPRVVNITGLKLTGIPKGKGSLRAELTLSTYTLRTGPAAPAAPRPAAPRPAAAVPSTGGSRS
jgi:type IV pilus assembly protein PilO